MLENIFRVFFCIIFLLFAFLQWNDPDPLPWIINYGLAALLSFKVINIFSYSKQVYRLSLGFIGIQIMMLALKVVGKQHLIHAEQGREFLGLIIVFCWVIWLDLKSD